MKRYIWGLSLLLSSQTALLGCATCVSLAEKNPKMPKNEIYVQLKPSSQKLRRPGKKKKKPKKTDKKANASTKKE